MRLYVIGPVTWCEGLNRAAFEEARAKLERAGYTVTIPHDLIPSDASHEDAMLLSIKAMLCCDGVAVLNDWAASLGATLEKRVAEACGIETRYVRAWFRKKPDCPEDENSPEETQNPPSDGAPAPSDEFLGALTRRMDETNALLRAIYHQIGAGVALNAALLADGNAEKAEEAKKAAFAISSQAETHYKSAGKENQDDREA